MKSGIVGEIGRLKWVMQLHYGLVEGGRWFTGAYLPAPRCSSPDNISSLFL